MSILCSALVLPDPSVLMETLSLMCEDFRGKWTAATRESHPNLLQTRYGPIAIVTRGLTSAVISGWLTFNRGSLVSVLSDGIFFISVANVHYSRKYLVEETVC
jgi:hypothetical protein